MRRQWLIANRDGTGRYAPIGSGVYLSSGSTFWRIASGDTRSATWDWGCALIPVNFLTADNYVSWAPGTGQAVPTANGSPVYVTAITNNTTVFVDYGPNDGVFNAREVRETGAVGAEPAIYGQTIAFATEEGAIGQDLNGDGDRDDPIVQIYRIKAQERLEPLVVRAILGYPSPAHGPVHFLVQGEGIREVRAQIYNLAGREGYDSGYLRGRELLWQRTDKAGRAVANGVYLYHYDRQGRWSYGEE